MNLSEIAIRRPVFTLMLMLALVVFGVLGYQTLPVNLLPSLDVPIVTIITILPGASPEVMESDVTDVLESAVNTIEGIKSLTSFSGQGVSQITVTFTLDREINIAAQDVRDKVSGAVGQLPLDAEQPIVQKMDINSQPMLWIALRQLKLLNGPVQVAVLEKQHPETVPEPQIVGIALHALLSVFQDKRVPLLFPAARAVLVPRLTQSDDVKIGVMGFPEKASAELGKKMFEEAVEACVTTYTKLENERAPKYKEVVFEPEPIVF